MRLIGLVLSLVAVSFAGCIEEGQFVGVEGADTSGTDPAGNNTDDSAAPGNGTAPDGNGAGNDTGNQTVPNTPPMANLTADVLSGEAPIEVTFTIMSSDADRDNLTWTLTVADAQVANGTASGSASHTFGEEGSFLVVLAVSDGKATATANLTVEVTAAVNAEPVCATLDALTFHGDAAGPSVNVALAPAGAPVYVVAGTQWASGVYEESNGIAGLQTEESCPGNPDTRVGP